MIGRYVPGETGWIFVSTHKFESGEEFDGTVTGYFLKVGDVIGNKVDLTFLPWQAITGVYKADIATAGLDESMYIVYVQAIIDGKTVHTVRYFEVRNVYGRYAP